jgi:cytochrome c-type biogenesis protein CcmH/NrfG
MYWIAIGLAGSSLIVSVTILSVMLGVLRSTRRAEQSGEERLELLREQQERLRLLREERRMLEEELQWRRSMMDNERLLLQLPEAPRFDGHPEPEQSKSRPWWRRLVGG